VQGKGLGRALISASAAHWAAAGKSALMLWAYSDNAYRKFYEKIGGELIAEGIDDGIPDVAYGWQNLSEFSAPDDAAAKAMSSLGRRS
jgi:GNAT superfamily N-acetyltransferase